MVMEHIAKLWLWK